MTMTDRLFDISLRSPLGPRNGTLVLSQNGSALRGMVSFFGKENAIEDGSVSGNTFTFSGNITTAAGAREYKATVEIKDNELHGEVVFYLRNIPVKIPLPVPMKLTGKQKEPEIQ